MDPKDQKGRGSGRTRLLHDGEPDPECQGYRVPGANLGVSQGMIYDCFLFFNETERLRERIKLLEHVVDKFILVESFTTFQGEPKPLYCDVEHPKLVRVAAPPCPVDDDWQREYHQRNAIILGLAGARANHWVIISDVDELPSPDAIRRYDSNGIGAFEMDLYYYNLNTRCVNKWYAARITTVEQLSQMTPNAVRLCEAVTIIPNGGKHCSCFGGPERIQKKM